MIKPELPGNERERLEALREYSILDTLPEADFDDITRLASEICETPISLITFLDPERQWFKSHPGLEATETPREFGFCAHAINKPYDIMVVPDSRKDIRFEDNPLVHDPATNVIFYAGVPLTTNDGFPLGTLCIIDHVPREITAKQSASLRALGNMTINLLELRRKNLALEKNKEVLQKINHELQQFAYVVSHDIRSPLNSIIALTDMLRDEFGSKLDGDGPELIVHLSTSSLKLKDFIDGILNYYKGDTLQVKQKETIDIASLIKALAEMLDPKNEFDFTYPPEGTSITGNKSSIEQIFLNLISNAIKYNDKAKGRIEIGLTEEPELYRFSVNDNGAGIDPVDFPKIFNVFETLGKKDRFSNYGTGIGLSTVKKLVERNGGTLSLESEVGTGTKFTFTLAK